MTLTPADPDPLDPDPLDADPLTEDDLAVDAVADGTATPAHHARVEADTTLQERVAELVAVRSRLTEPIEPLPADEADAMIRIALAAAPAVRRGEERSDDDQMVGPTFRRRRERTPWLVAAAILLLLGLVAVTVPRLTTGRTSSSDTASSAAVTSTAAPSSSRADDGTDSPLEFGSSAESVTRDPSTEDPFAASPLLSLGEVATVGDLVERALTAFDDPAPRSVTPAPDISATSSAAIRACLDGLPSSGPMALLAAGSIGGAEYLVIIARPPGSNPERRSVDVVRISDCAIVEQSTR